jgi:hypothetical protein
MQTPPTEPEQTRQRVKVAMTGLAGVLLLIGIAGVVFSAVDTEAPVEAIGTSNTDRVANLTAIDRAGAPEQAAVDEPLAELGVAPSKSAGEPVNVTVAEQPPVPEPYRR